MAQENRPVINAAEASNHIRDEDAVARLPAGVPFNPIFVAVMTLFLTPVVTGGMLANNWVRLGRSRWRFPTIAFTLILALLAVVIAAFFLVNVPLDRWSMETTVAVVAALALAFSVPYATANVQLGGYRHWEPGRNPEAMLSHSYRFIPALLISIGITAIGAAVGVLVYVLLLSPRTFSADHFSLQYPAQWRTINIADAPLCQNDAYTCLLVLNRDGAYVNLIEYELEEAQPLDVVEQFFWEQLTVNEGIMLETREVLPLDDRAAILRIARIEDDAREEATLIGQLYFLDDTRVYEMTTSAPERGLADLQYDLERVAASVQFDAASPD